MDKYDTSQITEFPRFEPESSQSGVSTFFNKLWKIPIFSTGEGADDGQGTSPEGQGASQQADDQSKQESDDKLETGTYAVEFEGRSLPNVLRRISSLVAMGSGGGTRYADTELARYWMPDDISRECYECAARFSTLRRRHHCRVCGQIFCSRCCSQRVPGHIFGCAGGLRVCNYCCNVVLSYLKENDMPGEISPDLRTLQENLQVKFPENKTSSSAQTDRFMFLREQDSRPSPREHKEALQDVFRHLAFTLPIQHHRYRLVRYNGVWRGGDILQWVMDNTSNKTRAQATLVCQNLLSAGYMESCTELPHFTDYALYKPIVLPPTNTEEETPEERNRLVESVSSYCLDLNLGESSARLTKTAKSDDQASPNEENKPMIEQTDADAKQACKAILESGEDHLRLLMRQCLAREGLSATWLDVLYTLCQQAADAVVPDLYSSEIDVRNYVQVKKVPGGVLQDSCVVNGVVITKNVAHRGMPQQLSNPTVLLLDCSIAYQRVEGKLTSLEPVLLQEQEYLVRCAARISALRPKVVLVRGSAARAVQDVLRHEGVALAVGVGERALHRAARCANADVVTSIDARIGLPRLGTCRNFYVKNFESKTLMVLENCAESNLGCCMLLRGGTLTDLAKVKKVAKFMLLACYNWKLEKSFLTDIEATLPEPGVSFVDLDSDREVPEKDIVDETSDDVKSSSGNTEGDKTNETSGNTEGDKTNETSGITEGDKTNETSGNTEEDKTSETANKEEERRRDEKEMEDPLKRPKVYSRKAESDKNLSCGVPIQDFSDPLHLQSTLSVEDEVFLPQEQTVLKADCQNDRWSTDDVVLSMSPNVVINAPYLETEAGRKCPLRKYFRRPLFPPRQPTSVATPKTRRKHSRVNDPGRVVNELHPFIKNAITAPCDDPKLKAALAHYRATGCRLVNNEHKATCPLYKPSVLKKPQKETDIELPAEKEKDSSLPLDPFSPESHQRLSLLFYSYSSKSANVPDFCVNPWIMSMEMYGARDISLGAFLEKYCFNSENRCPSQNCQVPMNQHVRKFVHGDVCITITCNTIGHSNVQLNEEQNKQVMFWSACTPCGTSYRASRLTRHTLSLSLATYLALRVSATRYLRDSTCAHPVHGHKHYFASRLTTACFKYNKISTWDIELPPEIISTKYDTKYMREMLINQLNELMLKGHEAFSAIADKEESEKEHVNFKQHMEQIHLALTSTSLQEQPTVHGVVRTLWSVSDRIILGEKMLRDASDKWASPAKPGKVQTDVTTDDKLDAEDLTGDSTSSDATVVPDETDKPVTEEDEEKGEKKTVRQIVSQLLSNNHNSNQVGMIISSGIIPVVVLAGEIGSVIAATLASITYQRTLHSLYNTQTDHEEAESSAGKDKTDGEKSKAKSNDHIEVVLKDGLLCRVYYASQFHKLRHSLLSPLSTNRDILDEFARPDPNKPECEKDSACCYEDAREKTDNKNLCEIEEGFIRSLAHCVPWAARGGKSGSTFCKTKDDRYVLKEMTKPEWQQFLEFAPHYFHYVNTCRQNKLPSLLARILGVYSVGGAGVLVTENVFYARAALGKRFDLKGSSRHRLTPDTQPQAVLMDDNLLHLRWDTQFYLASHQARVLWAGIERDTCFLAGKCVMDYSLLLGMDGNKLVLGIIDYIRTFTWDKKLEHLVKAHLGAGQPTVVSPDQYKLRFRQATNKYFLHCPERWDHLTHEPLS